MTQYATDYSRTRTRSSSARDRGALARPARRWRRAIVWAFLQPWRLTLLHPYGQGFWWLVVEPPLLVVLAGILFHAVRRPAARPAT